MGTDETISTSADPTLVLGSAVMLPRPMGAAYQQPVVHRLARRWALSGLRGSVLAWRIADRMAVWPPGPVEVWPGWPVPHLPKDYVAAGFYRGLYERAEIKLLRALLHPGARLVLDVGANVGVYTALFSTLVGADGWVIAFEPSPQAYRSLTQLIDAVGLRNVRALPYAVGRRAGRARLFQDPGSTNWGRASMRRDAGLEATSAVEAEVVALGELAGLPEVAPAYDSSRVVDLLKVDVEGVEAEVLAGAQQLFAERRVRFAMVEVSPEFGNTAALAELLGRFEHDYALLAIGERGGLWRRPVLRPLAARDVARSERQFNLLVARRQDLGAVPPWPRG